MCIPFQLTNRADRFQIRLKLLLSNMFEIALFKTVFYFKDLLHDKLANWPFIISTFGLTQNSI